MEGPMDRASQRHRGRRISFGLLWAVALLSALLLGDERQIVRMVGRRLHEVAWVWPLAVAAAITIVLNPRLSRWLAQPTRRLQVGLIVFVGLVWLAAALGPLAALLVLGLGVGLVLLGAGVWILPRRLAPPLSAKTLETLSDRDRLELTDGRLKLQNDQRTTALQAIGGLAVLAGAILAFQQLSDDRQQANATRELALQGQASERFTRAIDQLGSDRREVQLGGIYGLEQVARQAPDNRLPVIEALVAYLHRRVPLATNPPDAEMPREDLRARAPDVQAVLTVLGRRQTAPDDPELDLRALDLAGADLADANLAGANLRDTDLRHADLTRANLTFSHLEDAKLRFASLGEANLTDTTLYHTDLPQVYFAGAKLSGTIFTDANLADAYFGGGKVADTWFSGANLTGAKFVHINLENAHLNDANFTGVIATRDTKWPDGFDSQGAGIQLTDKENP
jgi:Pentapeptide repeats (8 copies)/Pentapeptide repeats (9 copies)